MSLVSAKGARRTSGNEHIGCSFIKTHSSVSAGKLKARRLSCILRVF